MIRAAVELTVDNSTLFIVEEEEGLKSYYVPRTPANMYAGQIGKARAKVEIVERDRYFHAYANSWGCGLQDHFGDITDMIAEEAGIPPRERYALRHRR
jgi:predicted proteasome-type protease